jgi:hypothetical protein
MGYPVARNFIKKYPHKALGLGIVDGAYFRVPSDPDKFNQLLSNYLHTIF